MSLFKKIKGAVKGAAGAVAKPVEAVARPVTRALPKIDPTSSKSVFGPTVATVVRPVVATSAAGLTGGASVLLAQRRILPQSTFGVKPTVQGYVAGAAIGSAALGGKALASLASQALPQTPHAPPADPVQVGAAPAAAPSSSAPGHGFPGFFEWLFSKLDKVIS